MRSIDWQPVRGQKEATGFLKQLSAKKSWTITQLEQKPAMQMMGLLTGHCHFNPLVPEFSFKF
jgi:hypothetical protein